jgi:hypothetical protein
MAIKTSVNGNRVNIDDSAYLIKPAGLNRYTVFDDFGGTLGNFTVRGKAIDPDDYGVEGVHPVLQIARLWTAANLSKAEEKSAGPESKVVCRVVTHSRPGDADVKRAKAHRAWLTQQPGFKGAYLAQDPETGKTLSISLWETKEHLTARKDQAPPDGAAPLKATATELFQLFEDL